MVAEKEGCMHISGSRPLLDDFCSLSCAIQFSKYTGILVEGMHEHRCTDYVYPWAQICRDTNKTLGKSVFLNPCTSEAKDKPWLKRTA